MEISIILPTYNRKEKLEQSLEALTKLNYPNKKYEITIINDGSRDNTKKFLEEKEQEINNLKAIHHEKNQGIAKTRNTGLKHAEAEKYIFFTDDDCIVPKDWIQQHLKHYKKDSELDAVNGIQWPSKMNYVEAFKIARHHHRYRNKEIVKDRLTSFGETNNLSYRTQVIEQVGEFNPDHVRGSDTEYGKRVIENGHKVLLDPTIKVKHLKTDTLKDFLKTKYRLGKSVKKLENQEEVRNQRKTTDKNHVIQAWKHYNQNVNPIYRPLFPILGVMSVAARKTGEINS